MRKWTQAAPVPCPIKVTLRGSPPKLAIFSWTQCRAAIWSKIPKLEGCRLLPSVLALRNPAVESIKIIFLAGKQTSFYHCCCCWGQAWNYQEKCKRGKTSTLEAAFTFLESHFPLLLPRNWNGWRNQIFWTKLFVFKMEIEKQFPITLLWKITIYKWMKVSWKFISLGFA